MNEVYIILLVAYLLGTVPFGLLLTRMAGLGDIRAIGSGNIGATNVLRTGNKKLAALTLLLDGLKGAAAVLIARYFAPGYEEWAALAALMGHIFPVWLKFKGGKGVATYLGAVFALYWPLGIAVALTWFGVFKVFRISSLSALIALIMAPLYAFLFKEQAVMLFVMVAGLIVILKHRTNIERLLKGEEPVSSIKNSAV